MAQQLSLSVNLLVWDVADADSMWSALKELTGQHGYRGEIRNGPVDGNDGNVFQMQISVSDGTAVIVSVGQIVVLMAGQLEAMSPEDYASKYSGS